MSHRNNKSNNTSIEGMVSKNILAILAIIAVLGIYLLFSGGSKLSPVIEEQFKAIQAGDMAKAYSFMSTPFQQQTTQDAFNTFIGGYPTLQQSSSFSITDSKTVKDEGAATAVVTSADGHKMQIDYQLAKDNKEWRIQGIRIAPLGSDEVKIAADNTGSTIEAIVISDEADPDGYVTKGKPTVNKLAAKIYATVQIKAPKAGGKVEATVTQMSNGAKIGPSVDDITKTGNLLKAFAFTRVTNAWAEGDYTVTVKLSSGDTKTMKFQVK